MNIRCGGSGLVHETNRASPCPSCFEQGISVSECRLELHHSGPGVSWRTTTTTEAKENNTATSLPACCYQLASVSLTSVSRCELIINEKNKKTHLTNHKIYRTYIATISTKCIRFWCFTCMVINVYNNIYYTHIKIIMSFIIVRPSQIIVRSFSIHSGTSFDST